MNLLCSVKSQLNRVKGSSTDGVLCVLYFVDKFPLEFGQAGFINITVHISLKLSICNMFVDYVKC